MTPEQVSRLVREVVGEKPLAVTRLTFGHSSVSFEVALAGRALVVRTNTDSEIFAKTSDHLAALRELGLPVSRLVASDLTKASHPSACMILEKIPGRDLRYELGAMTSAQKERLAEQIVGYQRSDPAGGEGLRLRSYR